MSVGKTTLIKFLVKRLTEIGIKDVFGVPGDFVLGVLNGVLDSSLNYIGTCNELNAAYAADGYARVNGVGCFITTYGVGELSAINGVAGAYAESIPVIHIVGVPATKFYKEGKLLHHTFGDYEAPVKMYQHVTCAQTILNNPATFVEEIDRVLVACLDSKQPVYIGVPADKVFKEFDAPINKFQLPEPHSSDLEALEEALNEVSTVMNASKYPIIIPGVEIIRRKLEDELEQLVALSGYPFTTMMLSKGILSEDHPHFIGLYCGDRSRPYVKERVESSDCVIIFGEKLTDFNTGGFTAMFRKKSCIEVYYDHVRVSNHIYEKVYIHDFLKALLKVVKKKDSETLNIKSASLGCIHRPSQLDYDPKEPLTIQHLFDQVANVLEPDSMVICETGVAMFAGAETMLPHKGKFIAQTFYGSIGYTVGATLGVCAANKKRKVYLFVGDGSFQVTCQDLSTMIRAGLSPTIFLLNNDGYTIERVIVDRTYNDIQKWNYADMPAAFGGKRGIDCYTKGDLTEALKISKQSQSLNFIVIHVDRFDCSDSLKRAGESMALTNGLL